MRNKGSKALENTSVRADHANQRKRQGKGSGVESMMGYCGEGLEKVEQTEKENKRALKDSGFLSELTWEVIGRLQNGD